MRERLFGYISGDYSDVELSEKCKILEKSGVNNEDIFIDNCHTGVENIENLKILNKKLCKDDIVIVASLFDFGRDTKLIVKRLQEWESRGIIFWALKENFFTNKPSVNSALAIALTISEIERAVVAIRIKKGIKRSRQQGVDKWGRPRIPINLVNKAYKMYDSNKYSIREICKETGMGKSTLYRKLEARKK